MPNGSSVSTSAIDAALRAARPAADETLLLRALILSDARGAAAWRDFKNIHADLGELFRTDRGELRRLSPLLARNLKANNAEVDARLWTVLRTALMRENLRAKIYQQVLGEVVAILRGNHIQFAVFRGAAVGALVYEEVAARHSHDIDVLVRPSDVEGAIAALLAAGLASEAERPTEAGQTRVQSVMHNTSLPVRVHTSVFEFTGYALPTDALLAGAGEANLEGVVAPVLGMETMLLHALVHASYSPTRHTLQWVPDAARLVAHISSWTRFVDLARAANATLATHAMLSYVSDAIDGVVPVDVRDSLRAAAFDATPFERDLALYGARLGSRRGVSVLFGEVSSVSNRALLAKWLVLPSAECVQWSRQARAEIGGAYVHGGRSVQLAQRFSRYLRAMKK